MIVSDFNFETEVASKEWLTKILTQNGYLKSGFVASIEQSSSPLSGKGGGTFHKLVLSYSDDSSGHIPDSFLMKITRGDALVFRDHIADLLSVRFFLPQSDKADLYQKETRFYEAARSQKRPLPTLECYGSVLSHEGSHSCLLLEDLSASHSQPEWPDLPDADQSRAAVKALARSHAAWWESEVFGSPGFAKVSHGMIDSGIAAIENEMKAFGTGLAGHVTGWQDAYMLALKCLPDLLKKRFVNARKVTIAHGDAHPGNILWNKVEPAGEAVLLDWQTWHIDTGAYDLAYFMGAWPKERRRSQEQDLLKFYLSELHASDIDYSWDELWRDYRQSIVRHLFSPVLYSGFLPLDAWVGQVEPLLATYRDLGCAELLTG